MKKIIATLISTLCLCSLPLFASCGKKSDKEGSSSSVTQYDVTFVGGEGATGDPVVQTTESGKSILLPENTFVKEGYEFKGWSDGSAEYQPGALYKVVGETTFTACWTKTLVDFAVIAYPTASTLTYGDTLADSVLSGGEANIEGRFEWVAPDTVPTVVNGGYHVKFVPDDTDYQEILLEDAVQITVNKRVITEIDFPTATPISYGDKLAESQLIGGASYGTFAWVNPNANIVACGTSLSAVVMTQTDDNYDLSGAVLTGMVSVEVQKKVLKVKATSTVHYGDDVPSLDAYEITYEGFVFGDDESVVTGSAKLGETTYYKGAEGDVFYGDLDVSELSAQNYTFQSMGADIFLRVKLAFQVGSKTLYDVCEYGEQYEFKKSFEELPDYVIESYTREGVTYHAGDRITVDAWAQAPFVMKAKGSVALETTDVLFTAGAKLYSGLESKSNYFDAFSANLGNCGVYPNAISWAYYRALLKGIDYREYTSLSFKIASNVALKLHMTDGSPLLTMVGGQTYVFTVQKDGSIYIDGTDSGKDFVNGTITFDVDRTVNPYGELHIAKTMTANGSQSVAITDSNILIYGIQSIGNMFAGKAVQAFTPSEGLENIGYQSQDVRKITFDDAHKDVEIGYYYEFAINNPKVDTSAHEITSVYVAMNQGFHDLYCGGKYLTSLATHQQVKISVDSSGTVYLDDVSTNYTVDTKTVKFNIYLQPDAGWVSPYTTFLVSNEVNFEDPEVTSLSAVVDTSEPIYLSNTLEEIKGLLTVTAEYDNGTSRSLSNYQLSGTLTEGECTLTVIYKEKTTTVTVVVSAAEPTGIVAEYTQGETIVYETASLEELKDSLQVNQTFSDGTSSLVSDYTLDGTLTAGTSTITVTYGSYTATFTVNVTAVSITSISAVYTQTGEVYKTNSLDDLKANLVVTATYNNGASGEITDYTLTGTLAIGESTVTVTAGDATATFTVTVSAGAVALDQTDLTLTAGAKLYFSSYGTSTTYFDAISADLGYCGNYPTQIQHAYYRFLLKGVDYRNYTSFSFNVASNIGLKLHAADGTLVLTTTAGTAHKITVMQDGSLYVDGADTGKDMENGAITLDIDRTASLYGQFHLSTATEVVGGNAVTLSKDNIFITALENIGTLFGRNNFQTDADFGYCVQDIRDVSVGGKKTECSYYEFKISKDKLNYTEYDSISFNLALNQDNMHELYCGGIKLTTLSSTSIKITVKKDGTVYVNDVATNAKLSGGEVKFNILVVSGKEATTSQYTQVRVSNTVITE